MLISHEQTILKKSAINNDIWTIKTDEEMSMFEIQENAATYV